MRRAKRVKRDAARPGKRQRLTGDQALTLTGIVVRVVDIALRFITG